VREELDLKGTINLPRTRFRMKANLPVLEPRILKIWEESGIYGRIRESRKGRPLFILHDGPPYANGHLHVGHALNKILKDLIVRSKTMEGYDCPYVPGWDCHGLPIEIQVMDRKRADLDPLEVRRRCRRHAGKFVRIQGEEFRRLGITGDWAAPYLTMSHSYEAETARLLGDFVRRGSVYKGLKPVHWCIHCETALAEAEVEYSEHVSPSVYVRFPVTGGLHGLDVGARPVSVLIWTTTPWTLPANLGLCFHPDFEYALLETRDEIFILAADLVPRVSKECDLGDYRILGRLQGAALGGLECRHPWIPRRSAVVFGNHVTLEQGTGVVHTAPGHGEEDYRLGVDNGLEIYCPVDDSGRFLPEVDHFGGMPVFEANPSINKLLAREGHLVREGPFEHSYPHCWRCHNPVIFRATAQWFISMDREDLRGRALREISRVKWLPSWGRERIHNMISSRPDWCISRQRTWGVPIVAFYCKSCGKILLESDVIEHVSQVFEREGADAWYRRPASELLPESTRCACGSDEFEKDKDILDVWFDSGVSHHVLRNTPGLDWPADLYLEGGDQFRGWFHSSLLVGVGVSDGAPYRSVLCHGWTLDADGKAMSKSRGNVISPQDITKRDGAEILRLWVSSIDYTEDVRLGEEILSRLRDAYRKLRNTSRFLLGNLHDFSPELAVPDGELLELDRWALAHTAATARRVEEAYRDFEFHTVYHSLYHFCVVGLSSFYLDVLKDRLYVSAADSRERRSAQTALFRIADALVRLLAPMLPFTTTQIWEELHGQNPPAESVHMAEFSRELDRYANLELLERWEPLLQIRNQVSKSLEECRQEKVIGNSLEATVRIEAGAETYRYLSRYSKDLASVFIVSEVELGLREEMETDETKLSVTRTQAEKCARCWNHRRSVGTHPDLPHVCSRCRSVLEQIGALSRSPG
jgi:isoleucyl-tRNA synthetase